MSIIIFILRTESTLTLVKNRRPVVLFDSFLNNFFAVNQNFSTKLELR